VTEGVFNTLFVFSAVASVLLVYLVFKAFLGRDLWEEERQEFLRPVTLRDILSRPLTLGRPKRKQTSYWPIICFLVFFMVIFFGLGFVLEKLRFLMPR